jgi:hypothetical protein
VAESQSLMVAESHSLKVSWSQSLNVWTAAVAVILSRRSAAKTLRLRRSRSFVVSVVDA